MPTLRTASASHTALTADPYDILHRGFHWQVPARFNIAQACCSRWAQATPQAVAVRLHEDDGPGATLTYGTLEHQALRLAQALRRQGVGRGDRVAVVLPQGFEAPVAHMALYLMGAVAMPLSMLFGPEALEYRLRDSVAGAAIGAALPLPGLRQHWRKGRPPPRAACGRCRSAV